VTTCRPVSRAVLAVIVPERPDSSSLELSEFAAGVVDATIPAEKTAHCMKGLTFCRSVTWGTGGLAQAPTCSVLM